MAAAWSLLLGDELHYGVFENNDDELPVATRRLTDLMVEAADLRPGQSILDVGCGSGGPATYLAAEHDVVVTGITTSVEGIAASRERAAADRVAGRTEFIERDGMANGFPDASFDRVWVLESSHLMRHRDRLIAECARVLKPGGRVVLCDIVLRREMTLGEVRERRTELALLRDVFGAARMEPVTTYVAHLIGQGLEMVVERDLTELTRPTFACWRENAVHHRAEVASLIGSQGVADFEASCEVLQALWDEGTLGYALVAAQKTAGT